MLLPLVSISLAVACILNDIVMAASEDVEPDIPNSDTECIVNGQNYPPGHTMCLAPAANMMPMPATDAEKKTIVDTHNYFRSSVDDEASDMMKMYWDEKLAEVAQKWAETCPVTSINGGHDMDRSVPAYGIVIGQNGAFGTDNFTLAIVMWHNEINHFQYDGDNQLELIGHFTQVVAGHSDSVGCGRAFCPEHPLQYVIFCNYAYGQEGVKRPYEKDDYDCEQTCGTHCINNLCDCGDKICRHGGTLILSTCECSCLSRFSGESCETFTCPPTESNCYVWGNTPSCSWPPTRNDCPFLCGLCEHPCDGLACQNGGTLELDSCTCSCPLLYMGPNCETLNCPETESNCFLWGVSPPCGYTPTANDCPFTCGICEPPCEGKNCINGGTLDPDTCTCSCPSLYSGDSCQTLNCPDTEPSCQNWGTNPMCTWPATRNDCPFTCGLCERPCNGLICQNGGTLVTSSCTCTCPTIFSGDMCETLNCPATAETFCGYNTIYCDFMVAKVACPYTCGLCP